MDELNRRRSDMDCAARMVYHLVKADAPTISPARQEPLHKKKSVWSWIADVVLHIVYFLSPILVVLVVVVICLPYALFEGILGVSQGFSFVALCLTVAFWIVLLSVISITPWKKLCPNRQWLIVPIRHLRKLFRHLEVDTRP